METTTLSTKGQLVIPSGLRKALDWKPGDRLQLQLAGGKLVLQREERAHARVVKGKFGRPVLIAPKGAPPMTAERIKTILEEND